MSTQSIPVTAAGSKARRPSDPRRLHRRIGGLALIAAPAALLISEVTDRGSNNSAQLISYAAQHPGLAVLSNAFLLLSSALLVPAAFAVLHLARDRGRRFAEAGAVLAVLGALGHAAFVGFSSVVLNTPQGDHAQMVALLDRVNHSPALAPVAVCIFAFALSLPLLMIGAWRAGLVPVYVPAMAAAAVLIEFASVDGMAGGIAKELLAVVAMGWIGVRILRLSDSAWAGNPR